jgi:hypothetical protein
MFPPSGHLWATHPEGIPPAPRRGNPATRPVGYGYGYGYVEGGALSLPKLDSFVRISHTMGFYRTRSRASTATGAVPAG